MLIIFYDNNFDAHIISDIINNIISNNNNINNHNIANNLINDLIDNIQNAKTCKNMPTCPISTWFFSGISDPH